MLIPKLHRLASRVQRRIERSTFGLGNRVECPYCGWTGWRFLSAGSPRKPNRLCPGCASLERYRMLPLVIAREVDSSRPQRVLELAPKPCFTEYSKRHPTWSYVSSDLSSPSAMVLADLRKMPFDANSFDLIVCFHVLEHIVEDDLAFSEIRRILSPDGVGILCVPLRGETTQEGAPEADWERLYGQADHVRYYGMDIETRMRAAGLNIRRIDTLSYFKEAELDRHGLRGDDRYLFLVRKESAA